MSVFVKLESVLTEYYTDESWTILSPIEQRIKQKVDAIGIPLRDWNIRINFGVKTGFNGAFIINGELKDTLIAKDARSAELIRPILRGRDISRYSYSFSDLWLLNVHNGLKEKGIPPVNVDDYPAIKDHLLQYYEKLEKRADKGCTPFNLRNCAYMDDFSKQKMVWKRIGSLLRFSLDEEGTICLDSTCIAVGQDIPFLVAVLNSTIGNYLFANSPKTGTGDLIVSVQAIEPIRVPKPNETQKQEIENLLRSIISKIHANLDYSESERELEDKVYELYGLGLEERKRQL